MALSRITWQDTLQLPDDGKRYEAIEGELHVKRKLYARQGVAEYWIVDPEAGAVERWSFLEEGARHERHTDQVPVRVGDEVVGRVDLDGVFERA